MSFHVLLILNFCDILHRSLWFIFLFYPTCNQALHSACIMIILFRPMPLSFHSTLEASNIYWLLSVVCLFSMLSAINHLFNSHNELPYILLFFMVTVVLVCVYTSAANVISILKTVTGLTIERIRILSLIPPTLHQYLKLVCQLR